MNNPDESICRYNATTFQIILKMIYNMTMSFFVLCKICVVNKNKIELKLKLIYAMILEQFCAAQHIIHVSTVIDRAVAQKRKEKKKKTVWEMKSWMSFLVCLDDEPCILR